MPRRVAAMETLMSHRNNMPPAYDRLKHAILVGDLEPGQALVETAVAEWLAVSRTPVREALTRLEHDGLIERTERGAVVRQRSPEEVMDIYDTRIVLEALAAQVAAERRSSFDLITMSRIADRLEKLTDPSPKEMAAANREFHQALWRAAHNEPLTDLLQRLDVHLLRYPATTLAQQGRWVEANAQHRQLIEAVAARDPARAADVSTEHFSRARDIRLALWDEALSAP